MADDGSLIALIAPTVATSTGEWLHNNITNPANPPIDKSLTVENAAADSKATGDKINSTNSDLLKVVGEELYFTWTWVTGEYVTVSGNFAAYENWHRSDYVALNGYRGKLKFTNNGNRHDIYNCFYNKDESLITAFYNDAEIDVPEGAEYFAVSIPSKYTINVSSLSSPFNCIGNPKSAVIKSSFLIQKKIGMKYTYLFFLLA